MAKKPTKGVTLARQVRQLSEEQAEDFFTVILKDPLSSWVGKTIADAINGLERRTAGRPVKYPGRTAKIVKLWNQHKSAAEIANEIDPEGLSLNANSVRAIISQLRKQLERKRYHAKNIILALMEQLS